jgi:hypothetical protein
MFFCKDGDKPGVLKKWVFWPVSTDDRNIDLELVVSQEHNYEEWNSSYMETCLNACLNL